MEQFCPQCGAARVGAFRFCRGCRLDFDELPAAPTQEAAATPVAHRVAAEAPAARTGRRFSGRTLVSAGLVVVVGIAAIGSLAREPSVATSRATATPALRAAAPSAARTPATAPESTFGPTSPTTEATVVRVTDGDTIVVSYGGEEHKVRYIGMDTPETVDPNDPLQWMGPEATKANEALVEGKTVFLEKDVSEVDRFDRLLRYVWLTDGTAWTLVNLELVRQGVAFAKSYPPDVKYDLVYAQAEGVAQNAAIGLWQATPAPATAPPAPVFLVPPVAESKCHPSYDPCLPIVDDLDCKEVRAMGKDPVRIEGSDPYRLDGSDNDGLGCE